MKPLYKISNEYQSAFAELENLFEHSPDLINDSLIEMRDELENKCLNVAAYIKNLEVESDAIKKAEDAMKARRTVIQNKMARLKFYLAEHLPGKLSNDQLEVKLIKGRQSVVIDDEELLPEEYFRYKREPDKTLIKNDIDELPEGAAHLETGKPTVSIK